MKHSITVVGLHGSSIIDVEGVNSGQETIANARSRDRRTALSVIAPRIREVHQRRMERGIAAIAPKTMTEAEFTRRATKFGGRYLIDTSEMNGVGKGICATVFDGDMRKRVFSAWIDCPGDDQPHVMSWKRGEWEAALFQ